MRSIIFFFPFLSLFSTQLSAQSTVWRQPRHQFSATYGRAKSDYDTKNAGANAVGLNYTFNLKRNWWIGAEWQTAYKTIDWYKTQFVYYLKLPPTELPVMFWSGSYFGYNYHTVQDAPVVRLPKHGFIEHQNLAITAGYALVTPRNVLRFGVGISRSFIRIRDVARLPGIDTRPFLLEYSNQEFSGNAVMQYDFFLKPNWTVGVRFMAVATTNNVNFLSSLLSVGYALPAFKKQKPRA